jgi:hypothetical protein
VGGYSDVALFYDGKMLSVFGANLNGYAQFDAPADLDQLIQAIREGRGVALPGADLLVSDPYSVLTADVLEDKYMGRGVIGGVECEHLAFRNLETDWQLWVEVGPRPIPRKMVITSKTMNCAPQYTLRITSWETDVTPEADAFTFVPPATAEKLSTDALTKLDELPEGGAE